MKKFLLSVVFAFIAAYVFSQERIAVFPFEDMDNVLTRSEAALFYRQFSNEFSNRSTGRFIVIPRSDVERLIGTEAAFQLSDFSAREKTAEMNRVLNGTQILSGIIGKVSSKIAISISLYTYPELVQLPGGVDLQVANMDELFSKIPELIQSMYSRIAAEDGSARPGSTPAPITSTPATGNSSSGGAITSADFVRVEGGTFQMGSTSGGDSNERTVHSVTVRSFSMGKYPVTQKDWYEVMGTTVRQQRDMANRSWALYGEGDNYPMYYVSWLEAVEYCNRRSVREGLTPAYSGSGNNITCNWNANGYRLPTEAEWEFAAKGGNRDTLVYEYSGSNNLDSVGWHTGNSGGGTRPVGTKAPNSLGLYDMSGNVWEWCWDWYGNYTAEVQTDPRGAVSSSWRVLRGGSWFASGQFLRSASRFYNTPSYRYNNIGFRVVRNAQ